MHVVTSEDASRRPRRTKAVTDFQPTTHEPHPLHTLISWPAVIAGAIVAVAIGAMLNLLGVAIGAAALNPFSLSRDEADAFSVGAGVWVALANAIALFIGAVVASRAAKLTDHHRGMLQGLSVWAVAFLMAIFIAGSTAAGGLTAVLNGAAENAEIDMADAPPPPIYYERGGPMVLVDPNNPPAGVVPPVQGDAGPAVPTPAQPAAERTGRQAGRGGGGHACLARPGSDRRRAGAIIRRQGRAR